MTSTIELFKKMVSIDSESGNEDIFVDFCCSVLKNLKFNVCVDSFGNIIAANQSESEKSPMILSAHLDTVKPGQGIKVIEKNGVLKSEGETILAVDNKLSIAIYFDLIQTLLAKKLELRPLEIILTRQEELGMVGARNLDYSRIKSRFGISLDAEGPIYHYTSSSPFAEIFEIKISGRSAHASRPEEGIDALKIFSIAYAKLKTGLIKKGTTINFGLIKGGQASNSVVGDVCVEGNFRSHDKKELAIIRDRIKTTFLEVSKKFAGKVLFTFRPVMGGYRYFPYDPFIKQLSNSISKKLSPNFTNGGSDANIFAEHGIKIIEFCHGAKFTHTPNEEISLKAIEELREMVQKIILNF